MRLRGYDEETEELSDDLKNITGDIADLTKTASNGGRGISLFTDESRQTYKSTYEIIKEISEIWNELSDKNQAELLEKIAGKRNSQTVAAAIKNFKAAEKAMTEMADSSGNAMAEMEIAYGSIEYKINQFKETITDLGKTLFKQDFLKRTVGIGTSIINILDKIIEKIGIFPTIIGGTLLANGLKNAGIFSSGIRNGLAQYGQSLTSLQAITGTSIAQTELLALTVQNLTPKQQALALATNGVSQSQIAEVLALNQVEEKQIQQVLLDTSIIQKKKELTMVTAQEAIMAQGLSEAKAQEIMTSAGIVAGDNAEVISKKQVNIATLQAKLAQEGLSATQIKAITTQLGLKNSTYSLSNYFKGLGASVSSSAKAFGKFLISSPMGWATIAVTAITLVGTAISKYKQKQEEAKQKAEEAKKELIENVNTAQEEADKIADLTSQYEKYKNVVSLTSDDKKNLKTIQDQLIESFGREADGIDIVNGKYDEQIQKIRKASEEKLKNYEINAEESYKTVKKDSDTNKTQVFQSGAYYNDNGDLFGLNAIMSSSGRVTDNKELIRALENIDGVVYDSYGNGLINIDAEGKSAEELKSIYLDVLETLKKFSTDDFDFTQTDIYKDIVANYQHYSDEAEVTYDAAKSLIDSKLRLYELSNGSYKELGRDEYLQWIKGFKSQFDSNDKDLNQALEETISQMNIEVGEYISSQSTNNLEIFHNFTNYLKNSENGLKSYSETIGDIVSSQEEYSSIIEQQTKDGKLSSENIKKLVKDGKTSILVYDDTVKGYKASVSELNKISQETSSQELSKLKQQKQELLLNYNNSKAQLENLRKNIQSESDVNLYSRELNKINIEYKETNALLDTYISLIEMADDDTSEYADSISKVNEELERQKTEIEKLDSGQSTIEKAIEEQKEFGHLSASSIKALHEAGLGTALAYNEATGETTLLIDSVEELYKAMIKAQEEAAKISLNNLATEIEEIENRLNNFSVNSVGDVQKKASLESDLAEKKNQYEAQNQNIQVLSSLNFQFNSTVEDSAEEAKEEYIKAIKEAFDKEKADLDYYLDMNMITQEEYYNQLGQLNEKYFKGKEDFLDEYRQYEVEIYKGLKQIQEEQINNIKESFDTEKDNLDYYLDMELISQEEYYNRLNQLNEQYFKGKSEFLDEYRQYEVEVYKGLKQIQEEQISSIKEAFDKEKSELDHLNSMNAIKQEDYYNKLFELNEKYFKGKTELLDEYRQYEEEVYKGLKEIQIKALQEQIDALKSVNEEKQEEIDLEKAKQALENAKRNKTVKVYDSERGWIRETDKTAIDSAQKEYDDLVLNEKVETLENLIESIENGTNTSHNLDESVNAVEQVNSLGQRVIPGNVDLTQLFSGAVANRMNEIQNFINSNIPATLANQFDKSVSSDSYTTNNNTITLNGVTVMANNPEEFIAQMEDIANERFKENFPAAMNQFGRDLKRYQMNHSF